MQTTPEATLTPVLVRVDVTLCASGARLELGVRCAKDPRAADAASRVFASKGLTVNVAHHLDNNKQALFGLAGLEGSTLRRFFEDQGVRPVFELFVDGTREAKSLAETAADLFGTDEWVDLGQLYLDGRAHATDPCYGGDIELLLAPGVWRAQRHDRTITWFGVGDRVWALRCWHPSFDTSRFESGKGMQVEAVAGVDSGMLGLVCARRVSDARESPDYEGIFEHATSLKQAPYRDFGWFVPSGIGDGGYDVLVARNETGEVIAVLVQFITEDDR